MSIIYSFLFAGIICMIAEIILNFTKLTPGHVTSLFSVMGAVLSFLGIYKFFINKCNMGATVLISNFGNSLYESAFNGYLKSGIFGIFKGMFTNSSFVLSLTIVLSFIFACFFKSKD